MTVFRQVGRHHVRKILETSAAHDAISRLRIIIGAIELGIDVFARKHLDDASGELAGAVVCLPVEGRATHLVENVIERPNP
ncbi:hypothetical protein ASG25_21920 [Rhizobium sp. Leaf384]|nr:hypothetical protein ASG25_21920 [Rhizobium sp. Leaf384]